MIGAVEPLFGQLEAHPALGDGPRSTLVSDWPHVVGNSAPFVGEGPNTLGEDWDGCVAMGDDPKIDVPVEKKIVKIFQKKFRKNSEKNFGKIVEKKNKNKIFFEKISEKKLGK